MHDKAPSFQFYPKDFLSDSKQVAMSLPEVGVYIRLLCLCWNDGTLPADVTRLARLVGASTGQMQKMWTAVGACFRPHPTDVGRLIHPRLEKEREKQEVYRQRQSDKGKASAANRKATGPQPNGNHGSTTVDSRLQPEGNSSSSSSSSSTPVKNVMTRARGHANHAFCGKRFCISHRQHELFTRELGSAAVEFDLLGAYLRWDVRTEPIDNLLPWVKARISEELKPLPSTVVREDWRCQHQPACYNSAACQVRRARERGEI